MRDVAVAIVTYKSADLTIDCLRSIAAERSGSALKIRVIVVDNASGDAPAIAEAIRTNDWSSWVTLIELPRNGGYAYGNNLAIQRAYQDGAPDYVHLLNPDTRVLPGAIDALVNFLETHPDVGIAGSRLGDASGKDWGHMFRFPSMVGELEGSMQFGLVTWLLRPWVVTITPGQEPQQVDWVSGASKMIWPEVIDTIGGLDEGYFLYFEDSDFCFRAKRAGFSTWSVPQSRIMHVSGQSTKLTGHQEAPRRMPGYWYDSRRHYFAANYGVGYAIVTDIIWLFGGVFGLLKRTLQGRSGIPHMMRDLACHSLLWPGNRKADPKKRFVPVPTIKAEG